MSRLSPAEKLARIRRVTVAWESLAPQSSFFGRTFARFREEVAPSHAHRLRIAELRRQLQTEIHLRDEADRRSMQLISGVRCGVGGDPAHGLKSALYEAMGFTREDVRVARIRRTKRRKRAARSR